MVSLSPRKRIAVAVLSLLCVALSLYHVALVAQFLGGRLAFPFDLDWMEGGQLCQAQRLVLGLPVYGELTNNYAPFAYAPLHFIVLAALGHWVPLDYLPARCLSLACSVATITVICWQIKRSTPQPLRWLAVCSGVGMAAAAYFPSGAWFEIARTDSLALLLPIAAAAVVVHGPLSRRQTWAVALLCTLAIYAKQTGVCYVAFIAVFIWLTDRRRAGLFALLLVVTGGVPLVWAQWTTDGWFWQWMTLMARHPVNGLQVGKGLWLVAKFAPLVVILPVAAWVLWRRHGLSRPSVVWLGMVVAALPGCLLPFAKQGGYLNNLLALLLLVPMVTWLLVADWLRTVQGSVSVPVPTDFGAVQQPATAGKPVGHIAATHPQWLIGALLLANVQLLWAWPQASKIAKYQVSAADSVAAERLHAAIAALPGEVLIPDYPFLAWRNRQHGVASAVQPSWHSMAWQDVLLAGMDGSRAKSLASTRADWLIVSQRRGEPNPPTFAGYTLQGRLLPPTGQVVIHPLGAAIQAWLWRRTASDGAVTIPK
ncbi:MAG: hypothetical protein EXR77_13725 [Myxococcales bacterium]|nr:hypothetical protein [Myxococcales bacterium]